MVPLLSPKFSEQRAVCDDANGWISYAELGARAEEWAARFGTARSLVFLYASNDIDTVAALLGALASDQVVALFDPALSESARDNLRQIYRPQWEVEPASPTPLRATEWPTPPALHPSLALLLSTSGSTGSPKLVRLTREAVEANAEGIADVLHIHADDVAAGYLPLHYSYGLSVLTSHLVRGAAVCLTNLGLAESAFWRAMRANAITHMPGVPFHHSMMQKLGMKRLNVPSLRTLTQAGGHLPVPQREVAHEHMTSVGGAFYVLYGQTEAAPRMTTLQHAEFAEAPNSVGAALPQCRLEILEPDAEGRGEVVFSGPNVMLGYAESASDLARSDDMHGKIPTGDIGFLDGAGRLTLTGRSKRFAKLFGLRVNLDEIETWLKGVCECAVLPAEDSVDVLYVSQGSREGDTAMAQRLADELIARTTLPRSGVKFTAVPAILYTERGKIDYAALQRMHDVGRA